MLLLFVYLMILRCRARGNIRRMYDIEGNEFNDCCTVCCCTPCATIQMGHQMWDNPGAHPGFDLNTNAVHTVSSMPYSADAPFRAFRDQSMAGSGRGRVYAG